MVNDKEKVLISKWVLYITFIMMFISVILKLCGLNFFDIEAEDQLLNSASKFLENNILVYVCDIITLIINYYIFLRLCSENTNTKIYYISSILLTVINLGAQFLIFSKLYGIYYLIYSILSLIISVIIIDKKLKFKRSIIIAGVTILYQLIAIFLKNLTYNDQYDILCQFLLNFDFIILLLITYYLYVKKGSDLGCSGVVSGVAYLFSQRKTLFQTFQKNYQRFLNSSRQEKAEIVIYTILSLTWEAFTLGVLVLVAFLNHTIIECLFILTSFLITKVVFNNPFHFKNALTCFIVSNLTYYALNRITLSIHISFVVPITLGILLAFVTSKIRKEKKKEIYRGMAKDDLLEICKRKNLDKREIGMLTDFYCNRMQMPAMAIKYHYSERAIYSQRKKILEKLKN